MKGRNVIAKPSASSICVFCAHRLRPEYHAQRRYLQGSHAAAKPPATAAATHEYINESDIHHAQSSPTSSKSWTIGRTGSSSAFGRPAFGKTSVSISSSNESCGRIEPPLVTQMIELTEDERRARELISETAEKAEKKPRRLFNVYPSSGPESNRAGRPTPASYLEFRARDSRKQHSLGYAVRTGPLNDTLDASWPIKQVPIKPSTEKEKISSKESPRLESEINRLGSNWGHLKRRNDDVRNGESPVPSNRFSDDQTQNSKTSQYVPLTSKLGLTGGQIAQWGVKAQHTLSPGPQGIDSNYPATNTEGTGNVTLAAVGRKMVTWQAMSKSASEVDNDNLRHGNYSETPTITTQENKRKVETASSQGHSGSRRVDKSADEGVASSQKSETTPKWKGRDKSRRRNSFINVDDDTAEGEAAARAELKRQRKRDKAAKKAAAPTPIFLPEYISVVNLAAALKVRTEDFLQKIEELGFEEIGYDHILNGETAGLIAMEYNFEPFVDRAESEDLKARPVLTDQLALPSRPPIVTIMGHVDHGKTTLLDFLRKSSVAATEHGGITQHIGAFSVRMPSGKLVTFLDTPGHAAFLSMRQRGANVTDIVILVVAADDSVKPQTIEAINHAKAAKVPIIVAINKIDKDEANIEKVKQDLARHGVEIEDYGGDTQVVSVSGKTGQGMDLLDENVTTLSELLDIRAERDGLAEGWVIEASIKSLGKVATVLVRRGTMRPGDFIVAGTTWARIRCLRNEAGAEVTEAGPGTPIQIEGWKEQPFAGDEVLQAPDESKAKGAIEYRLEMRERERMAKDMKAINEARRLEHEKREQQKVEDNLLKGKAENFAEDKSAAEEKKGPTQVNFIIKGDVSGSVEAVVESILSIGSAEVRCHIIRSGVGQLSEFDVEHAAAAKGYLINFNTGIDPKISQMAETAKIKIIDHNVIYKLVDDVKATLSEYLKPLVTQRVLGEAEIAQVFNITIKGRQQKPVAGCKIKNGTVMKNSKIRVLRNGVKVFDGALASLKNVKKDVTEMRKGSDCGMGFEGWEDFHVGDQIQSYEVKEEKRFL